LIETIRREYLDQTLFWNQSDLERKLDSYKVYYNRHRCHTGLARLSCISLHAGASLLDLRCSNSRAELIGAFN
jgi:hypothetical protein